MRLKGAVWVSLKKCVWHSTSFNTDSQSHSCTSIYPWRGNGTLPGELGRNVWNAKTWNDSTGKE